MKYFTITLIVLITLSAHSLECTNKDGGSFYVEQLGSQIEITNSKTGNLQVDQIVGELNTYNYGYIWGTKYLLTYDFTNEENNYLSEIITQSEYPFKSLNHEKICSFDSSINDLTEPKNKPVFPNNHLAGIACCSWGDIPYCWKGC